MRATVITELGGPEVLVTKEIDEPGAGQGEVVVEIEAAGLNFIDTYQRSGLYPMELPFTPGLEAAGTVVEVGADVDEFAVGDRVAYSSSLGAYAQRSAVAADRIVPLPADVPFEVGAASMLQGMTAHYLSHDTYKLESGSTCLIHAGAGGVGLLLTQMAKGLGATVYTTVGTPEKAELSAAAGADHVILYSDYDFVEQSQEIGGERPFDVIYDGVGKSTLHRGFGLLARRGLMVAFGNASGAADPVNPLVLSTNGSLYLTRPSLFAYIATRDELLARSADLFRLITEGLDVRIGARYPLDQAADAHRALEGRKTTGKVLIEP